MIHRSRQEISQLVSHHSFLPLFTPEDLDLSKQVIRAAYDGGVRIFECTNRSPEAFSIFQALVPFVHETLPDLVLGAGTIMEEETAKRWYEAGAQFIVSPVIPGDVARYCEKNGIFWCPGAATLNEIIHAANLGADMVKIFPANYLGGPGFVKAILGPCPCLRIMPTGGVDGSEANLRAWFDAGVFCVGMGSQLFPRELIASRDFESLTKRIKFITDTIKAIKSEPSNSTKIS